MAKLIDEKSRDQFIEAITNIVDEETEKAAVVVRRRIHKASDRLAMSVLSGYSVKQIREELLIRVERDIRSNGGPKEHDDEDG